MGGENGRKKCVYRKCRKLRPKFVCVAQKSKNAEFVVQNDNTNLKGKYKLPKNAKNSQKYRLNGGAVAHKGKYKLPKAVLVKPKKAETVPKMRIGMSDKSAFRVRNFFFRLKTRCARALTV